MNCPHHSPKEENNRLSTFVADPANESDKENVDDNKTNNTKPSTDNTIVVKKDFDAATFTSKQTNTTASSSKDNSKTEVASSDDESSLASIDSDILRREVTTCNITRHTFRKELSTAIKVINLRGDSRDGKSSQQPRRRRALGDISNQKASSQSKKSTSKKGRAPRRTVKMPLK